MKMRWLSRRLLPRMLALSERREPDFCVVRGDTGEVYLRRWWIIPRNNFFNIYLHNMLKDDDAVLHDHMYISLSLVLTDGLTENFVRRPDRVWRKMEIKDHVEGWLAGTYFPMQSISEHRDISEGALIYRSSRLAHQLVVQKPAWTIFITGPRIKEWGFWCPKGFRHWKNYVDVTQDPSVQGGHKSTSKVGIGCGEQS